jgi:hypothetical protein
MWGCTSAAVSVCIFAPAKPFPPTFYKKVVMVCVLKYNHSRQPGSDLNGTVGISKRANEND